MLLALLTLSTMVFAEDLPPKPFDQALQEVLRAPEYISTQDEIRSIELDYASRELVLEPVLVVQGRRANENRQLLPGVLTARPRIDSLGVSLVKPFSTGTEVTVAPTYNRATIVSLNPQYRDTFDWQVAISQNLWRDAFGESTRLRRAREDYQRKQELADALLKQSQFVYDFEGVYWDWALARRVYDLQEKNVKRGREILKWVRDRFNRAAAESTDLLQAQALLTQRELQLATQQMSITQLRTRLERFVPGANWRPAPAELEMVRKSEDLVSRWKPETLDEIQQLTYLSADNEARADEEKAKEAREAIRPDLALQLAYGKNAIDVDREAALRRSFSEQHEYTSVGLMFRTGLDLGNERRKVESARAARDASAHRREARLAENKIAWSQLQKELADLKSRVEWATGLVDLQVKKANAERERYRKGRSTAFQAITFELDAAEAEINLWTLYALARKTEARARLFAR